MDLLLLDQEQEPEIPNLIFHRCEPFEIAIHECRIYDPWERLIGITTAKRIWEVLADKYTEPTYRERLQGKKRTHPWNTQNPTTYSLAPVENRDHRPSERAVFCPSFPR